MFHSARIKLTLWYLLIIMVISTAFSTFIYADLAREFDRVFHFQEASRERSEFILRQINGKWQIITPQRMISPNQQNIEEAKQRILETLIGVNTIILLVSTLAGYFLAGRTLRPIQQMVDDQNQFITDASHELNTPLTSLRTSIEVNLRNKKFTLADAKSLLRSNLEEVEHLQALSDELIILTQFQNKHAGLAFSVQKLDHIISLAIEKMQTLAFAKEISLTSNVPEASIMGDEKSLVELFVILLDNAIKYSPANTKVAITGKLYDKKVEIFVADQGRGIGKEDLPHIFDRFFRADKSRSKQDIPGYGLGLSIAKKIILVHQGHIHVTSELEKGTTFTIIFDQV